MLPRHREPASPAISVSIFRAAEPRDWTACAQSPPGRWLWSRDRASHIAGSIEHPMLSIVFRRCSKLPFARPAGFIARTEESDDAHGLRLSRGAVPRVAQSFGEQLSPRCSPVLDQLARGNFRHPQFDVLGPRRVCVENFAPAFVNPFLTQGRTSAFVSWVRRLHVPNRRWHLIRLFWRCVLRYTLPAFASDWDTTRARS